MAPEIKKKKDYNCYCADVYSLGIILFVLNFNDFPDVDNDFLESYEIDNNLKLLL